LQQHQQSDLILNWNKHCSSNNEKQLVTYILSERKQIHHYILRFLKINSQWTKVQLWIISHLMIIQIQHTEKLPLFSPINQRLSKSNNYGCKQPVLCNEFHNQHKITINPKHKIVTKNWARSQIRYRHTGYLFKETKLNICSTKPTKFIKYFLNVTVLNTSPNQKIFQIRAFFTNIL
jgi:hypothetical protein